ncbi:MAG: spermidine synthase [Tenuifilaceae bacterium]
MNRLNILLSYLYPSSIEITSSDLNPYLEVVFREGKYNLNSANANYSCGGLYELFKLVFRDIKLDWKRMDNVLILGFGTGCTVPLIQKYKPDCSILGVEIDEKVIELGKKYFDSDKYTNTTIVCRSAYDFIISTNQTFDLIIIDVYLDTKVPAEIETLTFIKAMKKTLNPKGVIIFNKLKSGREVKQQIPIIKSMYQEVFGDVEIRTIMQTGNIFIAKNQ